MKTVSGYIYDAMREPFSMYSEGLSLHSRRDGTFHELSRSSGLFWGGMRLASGLSWLIDSHPIAPAAALAPSALSCSLHYRIPHHNALLQVTWHPLDGMSAFWIECTLQNIATVPSSLEIGLRLWPNGETALDSYSGAHVFAQEGAALVMAALDPQKMLLGEKDLLSTRLTISAQSSGTAVFLIFATPDRKSADDALVALRRHGSALLAGRSRRLSFACRYSSVALPDPLWNQAWNQKNTLLEPMLRPSPSGHHIPFEGDSFPAPGSSDAYHALLCLGRFEEFTQGLLAFRDISMSAAPSGGVVSLIAPDGKTPGSVDLLTTANYACAVLEGFRWIGDESLLRNLFPFLTHCINHLSKYTDFFKPVDTLPRAVLPEIGAACNAYADMLAVLRLPGTESYRTYARQLGYLPPEPAMPDLVEHTLGDCWPHLSSGEISGLFYAVPRLMSGLFGITPLAHKKTLACLPALPFGWDHLELANLRVGQAAFSMRLERDGQGFANLTLRTKAAGWHLQILDQYYLVAGEITKRVPMA